MREPDVIPHDQTHGVPSHWVAQYLSLVQQNGEVLDVACGAGRHLALGLASGRRVVGVDRDVSVARGLAAANPALQLLEADLENGAPWPLGDRRFDGVIVTNYLWRALLPQIIETVSATGVLIYETFAIGNEHFGRPRSPDFLLRPGELIDAVRPRLTILAYEHVRLCGPDRIVQRIAALGHRHPIAAGLGVRVPANSKSDAGVSGSPGS